MGFPDYVTQVLPEDNILDSVAYRDELKKMNPQDDKQGAEYDWSWYKSEQVEEWFEYICLYLH